MSKHNQRQTYGLIRKMIKDLEIRKDKAMSERHRSLTVRYRLKVTHYNTNGGFDQKKEFEYYYNSDIIIDRY